MNKIVAIQPDDYTAPERQAEDDASSPRWARLLEALGYEVRWVYVRHADILDQLDGCSAFMWRWAHFGGMAQIATRLMPVLEHELGLAVYPDWRTWWHYDDKATQAYLLHAVGIPTPRTWLWFDRGAAENWLRTAMFPLVLKLATGAGSSNVRLITNLEDALHWTQTLFVKGVFDLNAEPAPRSWPLSTRIRVAFRALRKGLPPVSDRVLPWPVHKHYVLFQEFLPHNSFDTRVTVIGNRAFGFRRFNRPDDFRASGSGNIDWNPDAVDLRFVRLAFAVARVLQLQSCAIDGLYRGDECVVGEISYTYASWAIHACPGHWELDGDALRWVNGAMWPEEAQIEDFHIRIQHNKSILVANSARPGR